MINFDLTIAIAQEQRRDLLRAANAARLVHEHERGYPRRWSRWRAVRAWLIGPMRQQHRAAQNAHREVLHETQ
jgi:hypothetical protein